MPPRTLTRLLVLAAALGWAAFLAFVVLRLGAPSDGARGAPHAGPATGFAVSPLTAPNLQAGDVVLAVDGRAIESYALALTGDAPPAPRWTNGQTLTYTLVRAGQTLTLPVTLGPYPLGALLRLEWPAIVSALANHLLMAFLFWRRPAQPAARALFFATGCMVPATIWSIGQQLTDLASPPLFWLYAVSSTGFYALLWPAFLHALLVFPTPWPTLARRRWLLPLLYAAPFGMLAAGLAAPPPAHALEGLGRAGLLVGRIELIYGLLILAAAVRSLVAARDPVSRAQVRWVVTVFLVITLLMLILAIIPQAILGQPLVPWNVLSLGGVLIPAAFAVAILRHRLFDIDLLLNRALVYGSLTLLVVLAYAALVGALGVLFQQSSHPAIALLATGVVAVLLQPARAGLQRAANRLIYGDRDDPYAVLAQLGRRLETTLAADDVLPALVETVALTLKLPYAAVRLDGAPAPAASFGRLPAATSPETFPLGYQGQAVGQLEAAPRSAAEPFTPGERRLLADLARQMGAAAHTVRLNADLRHSREQLVAAREEERRRLRRDLHDGLGPQLASQTLTLTAARQLLRADPAAADALLAEAVNHAQDAITDIRRVVYGLRPPALDDLGLAPALREQVERYRSSGVAFSLTAPDEWPPLPAAVEVAAYYIAHEALTNVVRHARAQHCQLRLSVEQNGHATPAALTVEISDDGVGLTSGAPAGVGLRSMRERAEEVGGAFSLRSAGGGTTIRARLPIGGDQAAVIAPPSAQP